MSTISALFGTSRSKKDDAEHWIGISDMMSGLMMVFLFMAVAYMYYVQVERNTVKEIAVAYMDTQVAIHKDLMAEFGDDLAGWDAAIDRDTLQFTFNNPEVLFEPGSARLRSGFRSILEDFFPRYVEVLARYRGEILEIRIEGHTSSDWGGLQGEHAYFPNMALSQDRTRAVLEHAVSLLPAGEDREWTRESFAAVGYSSSKMIRDAGSGLEDAARSRRVNFRVMTDSEVKIRTIIERLDATQG